MTLRCAPPRRLGAQAALQASGFFVWGMMLEPDANESDTSPKPNSSPTRDDLRADGRESGADRGGGEVVEPEVRAGHRVSEFWATAGSRGDRPRSRGDVEVESTGARRAEREGPRCRSTRGERRESSSSSRTRPAGDARTGLPRVEVGVAGIRPGRGARSARSTIKSSTFEKGATVTVDVHGHYEPARTSVATGRCASARCGAGAHRTQISVSGARMAIWMSSLRGDLEGFYRMSGVIR